MDRLTPSNIAKVVKKRSQNFLKPKEDTDKIASEASKVVDVSNDLSRGGRDIDVRPRAATPEKAAKPESDSGESEETASLLEAKKLADSAAQEVKASSGMPIGYRSVDVKSRSDSPLRNVKDKYDRLREEFRAINQDNVSAGTTNASMENFNKAYSEFSTIESSYEREKFKEEVLIPRLTTLCYELETAIDKHKADQREV